MKVTFSKTIKDSGCNTYKNRAGRLGGFCWIRVGGKLAGDLSYSLIDGKWVFRFYQSMYGIGDLEAFNSYDRMSMWGASSFRKGLKEAKRIATEEIASEAEAEATRKILRHAYLQRRQDYHCAFAALGKVNRHSDARAAIELLRLNYLSFLRGHEDHAEYFGDNDPNESIPHLF